MPDLPIMLKVRGMRCVVVGGGAVAARRTAALLDAGARVLVIAPKICETLHSLEKTSTAPLTLARRTYQQGDLIGARLVVVATDDEQVNAAVARDAAAAGVLVNRADMPSEGEFTVPAHAHHGPVTLAVDTGGISAGAAAAIRRELSARLDPDWPRLLELVAPLRTAVQQRYHEPATRRAQLRKLTDKRAMDILKTQGADALMRYAQKEVLGIGADEDSRPNPQGQ